MENHLKQIVRRKFDSAIIKTRRKIMLNSCNNISARESLSHVTAFSVGNAGDNVLSDCVRTTFSEEIGYDKWKLFSLYSEVTDDTISKINQTKALVIGGGGLFLPDTNKNKISGWQWAISENQLNKISVPIFVYTVGYNYFRGQEANELFVHNLNALISKAQFVGLRNQGSCQAVKDLIVPEFKEKIVYQPCNTTIIRRVYHDISPKRWTKTVAFNMAFDRAEKRFGSSKNAIIKQVADAMRKIHSMGYKIVYVAHCFADLQFVNSIDKDIGIKSYDATAWTPNKLIEFYNQVDCVIGMRGHAQMIPFGLNCRIITLGSHEKMKWFLQDINSMDWYIELTENVDSLSDRIVERFLVINEDNSAETDDRLLAAQNTLYEITCSNLREIRENLRMNDKVKATGEVALKAGIWYVISSILVKAITVITTPIFTRLLTTEQYGTVTTFTSWFSLLITFTTLNLTISIGRAKIDYSNKIDDYVGSMQVLSAVVSGVVLLISILFREPLSRLFELSSFQVVLLAVYLFFNPAIQFYQNKYRYRYQYKQNIAIAWYTVLSTIIVSLLLIFEIKQLDRADLRIIGTVLPCIVLSSLFWIKSLKAGNLHINIEYWRYGLSLSLPLVLHTVSMHVLSQSDRIFIAKICGRADTGVYSLVYSYGLLLSIITNAVQDTWLPWFHDNYYAKNYEDIKQNSKKLVVLGCYVGLACIAFAPEAVMLLGGWSYMRGINCVLPVAMGVVCQYIYTHYVNIELHLKKTKYVSYGTIFAAGLNLLLNTIFIPMFGFVAAAYTTLISYFMLMIVHFFITKRVLQVNLYNNKFMFGSLIVTFGIALLLPLLYNQNTLRYLVILIGFISFLFYFRNYIGAIIKKILSGVSIKIGLKIHKW